MFKIEHLPSKYPFRNIKKLQDLLCSSDRQSDSSSNRQSDSSSDRQSDSSSNRQSDSSSNRQSDSSSNRQSDSSSARQSDTTSSDSISWIQYIPGHVFVCLENGHQLVTFDIDLQETGNNGGSLNEELNRTFQTDQKLIRLIVQPHLHNTVLLILLNGDIEIWNYKSAMLGWSLSGQFRLCSQTGWTISTAELHHKHNAIYWCEHKQHLDDVEWRICRRRLPNNDSGSWNHFTVGEFEILLDNSPECDLFIQKNSLLISPRIPEGLYLRWLNDDSLMELYHYDVGRLQQFQTNQQPVDFTQLILTEISTRGMLNTCCSPIKIIPDFRREDVYFIDSTTQIKTLNSDGNFLVSCQLQISRETLKEGKFFTFAGILGILFKTTFSFYSLATGMHVFEMAPIMSSIFGDNLRMWNTMTSSRQSVGFYTSKSVCEIIPLQNQYQVEMAPPERMKRNLLIEKNKSGTLPITQLNLQTQKFVDTFLKAEENFVIHCTELQGDKVEQQQQQAVIEGQIYELFTSNSYSLSKRQHEIERLQNSRPRNVLKTIQTILQLNDEATDSKADTSVWKAALAVEYDRSALCLPLFDLTCQLLYELQPEILENFLALSDRICDQFVLSTGGSTFKKKVSVYNRAAICILSRISDPENKTAIIVKSRILLNSDIAHSQYQALRLLLEHDLFEESVELVEKLSNNDELHCELYSVIFIELLQKNCLKKFINRIMELLPFNMTVNHLLGLLERIKCLNRDSVFARDSEAEITVADICPYLLTRLTSQSGR
ncbi:uncharacterized protein LOC141907007 isoform X2 [Tubulanus polymorphus]|uniref:uncharacterized protein LOC141907007 isoform X2 n=1 Tax=Tubulanus polymorphus TaxID=672921 RepID=UPI003DA291DA